MAEQVRLDLFGRMVIAERDERVWRLFDVAADGTRGAPLELFVPHYVGGDEIDRYLEELLRDAASPGHPRVLRIES